MKRRYFLLGALAASLSSARAAEIQLPPTEASSEPTPGPEPLPLPPGERVGFAVVGLGNLAVRQILPAFARSKRARLTALVSGDPAKCREIGRQHGLPASSCLSYQTFERLADLHEAQVVYVVLPNALHAEYTVRAAAAGKHVLCEKPMATSVAEAEQMIAACAKAQRKLMVAYRIQYEPHTLWVKQQIAGGRFGRLKAIDAVNTQNQGDPSQWRLRKRLSGGGSLPDIGLYCLNTTRFLLGEEPSELRAETYSTPGDPRFTEVEETVVWQMSFPGGVRSSNLCSYGAHEDRRYRVEAETGWLGLDPAFSYTGLRAEMSFVESGRAVRQSPDIEAVDQFATEMDHMAECVANGQTPRTPGEEGLRDQRLMAAIYESASSGRTLRL